MRDRSNNASILNNRVIKYVNDVIRKVYRIRSNYITAFGTDFSAGTSKPQKRGLGIEQSWAKTKIANSAVINGIRHGMTRLIENYIRTRRQTKTTIKRNIYLDQERVSGNEFNTNKIDPIIFDKIVTTTIETPKGYDGNFTFVKVLVPEAMKNLYDPTYSTDLAKFHSLIGFTGSDSKDAILYFSNQIINGWFSIRVAKTKESVIITTDINGWDPNAYNTDEDPYLVATVEFYRRGVE